MTSDTAAACYENLREVPAEPANETPQHRNVRHFALYQFGVLTVKRYELLDQVMAPTITIHSSPICGISALLGKPALLLPLTKSRDTYRQFDGMAGMANHRRVIEEIFATGDRAYARWRVSGELVGSLGGFQGQGQTVSFVETGSLRFDDQGRLTDMWLSGDGAAFLHSVGVQPEDIAVRPELYSRPQPRSPS